MNTPIEDAEILEKALDRPKTGIAFGGKRLFLTQDELAIARRCVEHIRALTRSVAEFRKKDDPSGRWGG